MLMRQSLIVMLALAVSIGVAAAQTRAGPPESAALIELQRSGVIRPAASADIEAWHAAVARRLRPFGMRPLRSEQLRERRTYVVLHPMTVPPDMHGGNSRFFIISRGVPLPSDAGSHNTYYQLEDGTCVGLDSVCGEIEAAPAAHRAGARIHCEIPAPNQHVRDLATAGPARLRDIHCHRPPSSHFTGSLLIASADARRFARVYYPGTVRVTEMSTLGSWQDWSTSIARDGLDDPTPARWDRTGEVLWTSLQERHVPGGRPAGPVRIARLSAQGAEEMPAIARAPGRLDRVRWIAGGVALAYFDTRGDYYRPELPNPNPTLAIIDARRSRVLDQISFAQLEQASPRVDATLSREAAVRMPNGGVRVVLAATDWIVWTQGQRPRRLEGPQTRHASHVLTPDGSRFLVSTLLSASGVICEHNPNCPPPTPHSGVWAALIDVTNGRRIWSIEGTAETFGRPRSAPIIRDDGCFALVPLPPERAGATVGLVSMQDGRILQRLPGVNSFGFMPNGIWLEYGGLIALYSLGQ